MQVGMFAWKMDSRRRLDVFSRFLRFSKISVFRFFVFLENRRRGFQGVPGGFQGSPCAVDLYCLSTQEDPHIHEKDNKGVVGRGLEGAE
jgi:hypothetical protein